MTNLFLYGLGFCCLVVIALLIWDAHLAKRRMREWAERWKPPGLSPSDDDEVPFRGGAFLQRTHIFKPAFLITMAAAIVMVAAAKWHSTAAHPSQVTNASAEPQNDQAGSATSYSGNILSNGKSEGSWSFTAKEDQSHQTFLQTAVTGAGSAWPEAFAWVADDGLPSNSEDDFNSSAMISLSLGFSVEGNGYESPQIAVDTGINCDTALINEARLNYLLNGSLLSKSSRARNFKAILPRP